MKNTTRIARLILAGTTAALLSHTPVFAETYAQIAFADMYKVIATRLEALQLPTDEMGQLSADELLRLSEILNTTATDSVTKAAVKTLFRDSLHPVTLSLDSPEALQMQDQLHADLARNGLEYPTKSMTIDQIKQLLDIFQTPNTSDVTNATQIISDINNHVEETMANPGAQQLKDQLYADLDRVGIIMPAGMVLTFDQVIELTSVFDRKTDDANKSAAAKLILGMI